MPINNNHDMFGVSARRQEVIDGMKRVNQVFDTMGVDEKMRVGVMLNLIGFYIAGSPLPEKDKWTQACADSIVGYTIVYKGVADLSRLDRGPL